MSTRIFVLVLVIALIAGAILFIQSNQPDVASTIRTSLADLSVQEKAEKYPVAIELVEPEGYFNTKPFNLSDHIGKQVILIDFWTYSCINCQRTLPYITAWDEKYRDSGLLIVGVHTPEFDFEKDPENVQRAIEKYNIKYPVVQDNDFQTWRAYNNRYWPRKYIIDIDGFIVYDHIGEGAYEETEKVIQELLRERATKLNLSEEISSETISKETPKFNKIKTPELYFGYGFDRGHLGSGQRNPDEVVAYTIPSKLAENKFYLQGNWFNDHDFMRLEDDSGRIEILFTAKQVNLVAGASTKTSINVYVDDKLVNQVDIQAEDLYTLVDLEEYDSHHLALEVSSPIEVYTFTFG